MEKIFQKSKWRKCFIHDMRLCQKSKISLSTFKWYQSMVWSLNSFQTSWACKTKFLFWLNTYELLKWYWTLSECPKLVWKYNYISKKFIVSLYWYCLWSCYHCHHCHLLHSTSLHHWLNSYSWELDTRGNRQGNVTTFVYCFLHSLISYFCHYWW